MSSFTSPLWVTPLSDGKNWKLLRNFTYHLGSKRSRKYISVPRGFVTDFASVPRITNPILISLSFLGLYLAYWLRITWLFNLSNLVILIVCLTYMMPLWARVNKSSPLHDWLYRCKTVMGKPIKRKRADQIFLEAMIVDWRHHKSRYIVAVMEYIAVRLFGWLAWYRIKIGDNK